MKIEQIKKALECCEDSEKCDVCPYYGSIHCQEILIKDAIGFINRQQAEIERLKTENEHFERNMKSVLEIEKENIRKETAKEFAQIIKTEIFSILSSKSTGIVNEQEVGFCRIMSAQMIYQINKYLNQNYGFNESLSAYNQLSCERELAKRYGVEVDE